MCTALVSVQERGHDIYCTVRYIEKHVKHVMPGDQLVFSLQEGLKQPRNLPDELAETLFLSTTAALTNHFAHSE